MENWKMVKKSFLTGVFFSLGIVTTAIVAVTVSATFTSGDTLTAANINIIKAAIESIPDWTKSGNDAVYTAGNAQIGNVGTSRDLAVYGKISSTMLGTFCGVTASTYDGGGVGGYTGAKSKCATACSDTRAHMCTGHEISISAQLGVDMSGLQSPNQSWYDYGLYAYTGPAQIADNCSAWQTNNSSARALIAQWNGTYISYNITTCDALRKIACCK